MATNSSIYDIDTFLVDVGKWKEELEQVRIEVETGKVPREKYETAKVKYLNDVKRNLKFINKFDSPEQKSVILQLSKKIQNSRKITPEEVNGYLNENFVLSSNEQQVVNGEEVVENLENTNNFKTINEENNQKVENTINELNNLNLEFEEIYNQDITTLSQEQLEQRRKKLEEFQTNYKELKSILNNIKQKTRNHIKSIGDDKEEERKLDLELINKIERESILYMEPLKKIELQLENGQDLDENVVQDETQPEEQEEKQPVENSNQEEVAEEIVEENIGDNPQEEKLEDQTLENGSNFENTAQPNTEKVEESLNNAEEYSDADEEQNLEQSGKPDSQSEIIVEDEIVENQVDMQPAQELTDEEFYKQSLENEANFEKMIEEHGEIYPDDLSMQEDLKKAEEYAKEIDNEPEVNQNEEIGDSGDEPEDGPEDKNYDLIVGSRIGKYLGQSNGKDVHELEENLNLMNNYISRNVEPGTKEYRNIRKVFKRIYYDDLDFNGDEFVSKLFSDGRPQYINGKVSREDREIMEDSIERYKKLSVDGKIPEAEIETFDKFVLAPYRLKNIVKSRNAEKEDNMVKDLRSQTVTQEELEAIEDVEFEEVTQKRGIDDQIK